MRLSRGGSALTALAAGSTWALGRDTPALITALVGPSFPDALLALGSLIQLTLSVWILLVVVTALPGYFSPVPGLLTPRILRRALFAGTAGALALAPVHAEEIAAPNAQPTHSVLGLPLPDRPSKAAAAPTTEEVLVRPGDTLWGIATHALPTGASAAEIASDTARWHRANRDVIGEDPDLIFPAQRLTPPSGKDPA